MPVSNRQVFRDGNLVMKVVEGSLFIQLDDDNPHRPTIIYLSREEVMAGFAMLTAQVDIPLSQPITS